jgi:hypothetical protein
MKENDVRERVQAFLKNTVRLVVVPASMGIGLALIGCSDSADDIRQDAGAEVASLAGQSGQSGAGGSSGGGGGSVSGGSGGSSSSGAGGSVAVYAAPVFDAGAGGSGGLPVTHPAYMASLPDAAMSYGGKYAAPMSSSGGVSSGGSSASGGSGGTLPNSQVTYGASWLSGGTGGRGGNGGTYNPPPSSSGGVPTDGGVPDADATFDGGSSDLRTGGTTTPVTRYGGIFPGSSSRSGS